MKKLGCLAVICLFLLAGCGGEEPPVEIIIEDIYEDVYEETEHEQLTIADFLADLDYMIDVLENNFALLEVANWAHGVDYRELRDNARRLIMEMEEPCVDAFLAILTYSFTPLLATGHFHVVDHNLHMGRTRAVHRVNIAQMSMWDMNIELLRSSPFYEPGNQERIDREHAAFAELVRLYGEPVNRVWSGDVFMQPVTMDIIEEGKIAYLSSGIGMEELGAQRNNIWRFLREVADYEHLILDFRGNGGGDPDIFINTVFRPLLSEPVVIPPLYYFWQDGAEISRFGDYLFIPSDQNFGLTILEAPITPEELLRQRDLPEINWADLERMDFAAPVGRTEAVIGRLSLNPSDPEFEFSVKIWMLTDHAVGSAAQVAAWLAKETGFATLVGSTTGGNFGGPRTAVLMPNTGIAFYFDMFYVTDERGRPLEAGTIPHHFNHDGMDALETVLAIIAE